MHPQPHDLTALAYGLISGPEREQMLEHLAACDDCRASYDAAFEEQSVLRQALVAEVRSGAVEARALDRTLAAIAAQPALEQDLQGVSRPVGRLFQLPRAVRYALEAAAVLALAAGLFFLAQPGSPLVPATTLARTTENPVPEKVSAPATLEGVVFASDKEGNKWEKTGAVTVDTWMRNDREQPAKLTFDNGLVCTFSVDAEFKVVSLNTDSRDFTVRLRSGWAQLDTLNATAAVPIETENNDVFLAMPGSNLKVTLTAPQVQTVGALTLNTSATANSGSVMWMFQTDTAGDERAISMLEGGDRGEMDRAVGQLLWRGAAGPEVKVFYSRRVAMPDEQAMKAQLDWALTQQARIRKVPVATFAGSYHWEGKAGELLKGGLELKTFRDGVMLTENEIFSLPEGMFDKYLPAGELPGTSAEKLEKCLADGEYPADAGGGCTVTLIVKTTDGVKSYAMRMTTKEGKSTEVQARRLGELYKKFVEAAVRDMLPGIPLPQGMESEKSQSNAAHPRGVPEDARRIIRRHTEERDDEKEDAKDAAKPVPPPIQR